MNFKVISSNNGRMPVFSNYEMDDDQHFSFQDKSEVPYFYFGDILNFPKNHYFSIGDTLVFFGFMAFALEVSFFVIKKSTSLPSFVLRKVRFIFSPRQS